MATNWDEEIRSLRLDIHDQKAEIARLRAALEEIEMQAGNVKLSDNECRFLAHRIVREALANEERK